MASAMFLFGRLVMTSAGRTSRMFMELFCSLRASTSPRERDAVTVTSSRTLTAGRNWKSVRTVAPGATVTSLVSEAKPT
jgi:hypothetical protein